MGQKPHLLFLLAKFDFWTRITSLYGSQTLPVVLCMKNCNFTTRLTILNGSHTSSAVLSTHNSVLSTRTKKLYWFQTSPVVLYMQNSDFRTRITSFCGSKTQPVDFACKTATSGPEQQVSMLPTHDLSFSACTRACVASEILVSMGPSPHLWFLHSKQRD